MDKKVVVDKDESTTRSSFLENCNPIYSGNNKGIHPFFDIAQLSPDCSTTNHEKNAKSTSDTEIPVVKTCDGALNSSFDEATVIKISNQSVNSKRKRKLKDFSDYETDYGIKSRNKRQTTSNGVKDVHSFQSSIENKATSSNGHKCIRSKQLDKLRNTLSKRQNSKVQTKSKKSVQNQQIVENQNKKDVIDKLENNVIFKNEMEDLKEGVCSDSKDRNQKCPNERNKLSAENDEKIERCCKESCSPSNIKVLSARVVPRLESTDEGNVNVDKDESKNTLETDKMTMDVSIERLESSRTPEIEKSCSGDVNGSQNLNTRIVPLSDTTNVIKKYSSTKTKMESNANIAQFNSQDLESRNWFKFSNLKKAIFQCMYENCTFSSRTHSDWLYHFKISHQKEKNKPIMARCLKCHYAPPEKRVLKEHLLVKHNDSPTAPVGYKFCRILHENSTHEMKILACIFCGFVMDEDNFSSEHKCRRPSFYFYCPWCDVKEMYFEKINNHIQSSHGNEIIHGKEVSNKHRTIRTSEKDPASGIDEHETTCKHCKAEFRDNVDLQLHINNEHAIFPFGCGVCRLCYGRLSSVRDHMKKVHLLSYKCRHCNRGFGCHTDLVRHESTHSLVKPLKCDFCDNRYSDKKALHTHIGIKHPAEWISWKYPNSSEQQDSFMCHLCGEHLDTSVQFSKHQQTKHLFKNCEKTNLLHCKICSQVFTTRRKYNFHKCVQNSKVLKQTKEILQKSGVNTLSEGGRKAICNLCNKQFSNRKSLQQHLFVVHLNDEEKRFACNECERRFWKKSALRAHLRIHRNCKPYHCKVCLKTFRQLGHVKEHLLSHASHGKFSCPLCLQEFKTKSTLRCHVFGHCKMFPFECPVVTCTSKSSTVSLLNVHFRECAEKNGKEFICKICDKDLLDVKSAITHMKFHEKDEVYLCAICDERFSSPINLCWHKIKSNHFTEDERECATSCQKSTQTFKCVEINSDVSFEKLVCQYEYVNQQDLEAVVNEDTVEECIIEQNDLSDITDQLTVVKQENCEINSVIENDAHENDQVNDQLHMFSDNVELSEAEEQRKVTSFIVGSNHYVFDNQEVRDILHPSDKLSMIEMQGNTGILSNEYSDNCENTLVVLTSQKNSESENSVIRALSDSNCETVKNNNDDNTSDSCLPSDSNKDVNQAYYEIHEDKNHLPTDVTVTAEKIKEDENVLAVFKLLTENEGYPIHIQGNQDVIQTILSAGRYSVQCTSSNTELDQESLVNDHILQVAEEQVNTVNGEFVHEVVEDSHIGDIICKPNDLSSNVEVMENVAKKRHDVLKKAGRNIDKIEGILTDKEAESTNKKMQNGNLDYKVRLCYYEDRSKNADEYPLKCELCDKRYKRTKDLNLHKKVHLSNDERPFQCEECGKGFTTRHAYRNHQRTHTGARPYSCNQCDKTFRQMGHLQTHLRAHADYRPFQCTQCSKTFLTNSLLKGHVKQNHSGTRREISCDLNLSELENCKCGICSDTFVSLQEFRIHQIKHLSKKHEFELLHDFSDLKKTDKDVMDYNESFTRPEQTKMSSKSQMCDVCGKIVTSLNRHKMLHKTDSKVSCHVCLKEFSTSVLLRSHVQQYHTDASFQCETCGIVLKNRYSLYSHMKLHKRLSFTCLNCKKKYVSKKLFLSHLVSCVGDKFIQKLDSCLV